MRTGAPVAWASMTTPGTNLPLPPRKGTSTARVCSSANGGASKQIVTTSLARSKFEACTATCHRPGHGAMFGRRRWRSTRLPYAKSHISRTTAEVLPGGNSHHQRPMLVTGYPLACSSEKEEWKDP
jgi:hypothetical protein